MVKSQCKCHHLQGPEPENKSTFHHLSVIDQTWDREAVAIMEMSTTEFLHWAYTGMLADGAARFARAFDLLADTDALARLVVARATQALLGTS